MHKTTDIISHPTLAELAAKLGTTEEAILSHCRKAELVDARCMIVAILLNRPHMRQQDIALLLDISQAAVSKLLARHRLLKELRASNYRLKWESLQAELHESCCATTI